MQISQKTQEGRVLCQETRSFDDTSFIDVTEKLPSEGLIVEVRGDYTPDKYYYPKAYLRDYDGSGKLKWCSSEWRGTVAIRQWQPIGQK